MIKIGDLEIRKIYLGNTEIQKAYLGDTQVYGGGVYQHDYLTFTAVDAGATVKYTQRSTETAEYSTDGGNTWQDAVGVTVTLANVGDSVKYRGVITENVTSTLARFYLKSSKKVAASGSVMSMYNNNPDDTEIAYTGAFKSMFYNCSSLTTAPELPATTLTSECYHSMFYNCTSLTSAPELPATTLTSECYSSMFRNCSSLTTAPELPATEMAEKCYRLMFGGCTSLTSVTHHITNWNTSYASNWLENVAPSGNMYCPLRSTIPSDNVSGCPNGWNIVAIGGYLTLTGDSNTKIKYVPSTVSTAEYSTLDGSWASFDNVTYKSFNDTVKRIAVRGVVSGVQSGTDYAHFEISGTTKASGSVMSLQNKNANDNEITNNFTFYGLFQNCSGLTQAPELPATTVTSNCYQNMFKGCTSLTTAPDLPATLLRTNSYNGMFYGCTSLTKAPTLKARTAAASCYRYMFCDCKSLVNAPALPATTLGISCYQNMFNGCTSLVNAPELPATEMGENCYREMFRDCSSLTTAPALPATELAQSCYQYMFGSCTSLVNAPVLPATTLGISCYTSMFNGCSSLTSAPALPATTLTRSCYYNMFNGCSSLVNAPALPATTLADMCYTQMFRDCTSLTSVTHHITSWNTSYATNWLAGVSASGTVICPSNSTIPSNSVSGIPSSWTRQAL